MGRFHRPRPTRLADKLLQIRLTLGLTQQQMLERLDYRKSPLIAARISDFELNKKEPPLALLLAYARTAGITLETLADDEMDLPTKFATKTRAIQAARATASAGCPYCQARDKQIKAGRNRSGSLRYQCRHCLRHYTPQPADNYHPNQCHLSPLSPAQ